MDQLLKRVDMFPKYLKMNSRSWMSRMCLRRIVMDPAVPSHDDCSFEVEGGQTEGKAK